ncbi:hypothetical protein BWZ32_09800 [Vibrio vulnificus]|nr:hypothetical protein BWZ32_09800 [Vibrio vulnificus]
MTEFVTNFNFGEFSNRRKPLRIKTAPPIKMLAINNKAELFVKTFAEFKYTQLTLLKSLDSSTKCDTSEHKNSEMR